LSGLAASVFGQPSPLVDLDWRPSPQAVVVGNTFEIGYYASSSTDANASVSNVEASLFWDPAHVRLVGHITNSPYRWLFNGFPTAIGADPEMLNLTWADGNAQFLASRQLAPLAPFSAPPDGRLVATFVFEALAETPATFVDTPSMFGLNHTRVFHGLIPNTDITGQLGRAEIRIVPEPASAALFLIAVPLLAFRFRKRPSIRQMGV